MGLLLWLTILFMFIMLDRQIFVRYAERCRLQCRRKKHPRKAIVIRY